MDNLIDNPPLNEAVKKFQKHLKKYKAVKFMEGNKRQTRSIVKAQSAQTTAGNQ